MKRFFFIAVVLPTIFYSSQIHSKTNLPERIQLITSDSTFQKEIDKITTASFVAQDDKAIQQKIDDIQKDKVIPENWKNYWRAYLYYYKAILQKNYLKNDDAGAKAINEGLKLLKGDLNTSENNALYAACLSFSIQFANVLQVPQMSEKVIATAKKSIALDDKNVRGYYVLASHNFHTPKMFGGMQKTEGYAVKGLSLPSSHTDNFYAPTWGRKQLYKILMSYYKEKDETKKLEEIYSRAVKDFPNGF